MVFAQVLDVKPDRLALKIRVDRPDTTVQHRLAQHAEVFVLLGVSQAPVTRSCTESGLTQRLLSRRRGNGQSNSHGLLPSPVYSSRVFKYFEECRLVEP